MITMIGTCKQCGEEFELKRMSARFCSGKCRTRAYRERKKVGEVSVRRLNTVTTEELENLIAEIESGEFNLTAGEALRELAKRIGAPIRDERIAHEAEEWQRALDLSQEYEA